MSVLLAVAATVGLGVGAASSTQVIVKVNGKDTVVKVAGAPEGNQSSKVFLQCLVAHRVLRVSGNKVTMLDGTAVATHLAEFAQSQTTADPCELGKAAYTPQTPQLASAPVDAPTPAATPTSPAKKSKHEAHISFGSAPQNRSEPARIPLPAPTPTAATPQPANANRAAQAQSPAPQTPRVVVAPSTSPASAGNGPVVVQGSAPTTVKPTEAPYVPPTPAQPPM